MTIAQRIRLVELDEYFEVATPASQARVVEVDIYKKKREMKPRPEDEARDALPADRNRIGWYKAPSGTLPGHTVGFAYAKTKNAAGFYVSFTIIWRGEAWSSSPARSAIHGWKTKRAAIDFCLDRWRDARRPKRERRFVIPAPK